MIYSESSSDFLRYPDPGKSSGSDKLVWKCLENALKSELGTWDNFLDNTTILRGKKSDKSQDNVSVSATYNFDRLIILKYIDRLAINILQYTTDPSKKWNC